MTALKTHPDLKLARKLNIAAVFVTLVIFVLVGMMRQVKLDVGMDLSFLPAVHAVLNTGAALMLVVALYFIKQKDVVKHRNAIYVAVMLSVLFLLSYVMYHFTTEETRFCKEGWIRTVYFTILMSHIVLAGLILPFILFTFIRAYTGQYQKHRKMARWVYPIWLYVAISGPVVYLMLKPCYT